MYEVHKDAPGESFLIFHILYCKFKMLSLTNISMLLLIRISLQYLFIFPLSSNIRVIQCLQNFCATILECTLNHLNTLREEQP